jgi:hypothetical protein
MGFLTNIFGKAKDALLNVYNRGRSWFTGGSNYIGPFNPLTREYIEQNPPKDRVDAGALAHDLDYSRIAKQRDEGKLTPAETKQLIRESDERFLENTKKYASENPVGAFLGRLGIGGKNLLEDYVGLNPNLFVTQKLGGMVQVMPYGDLKQLHKQFLDKV